MNLNDLWRLVEFLGRPSGFRNLEREIARMAEALPARPRCETIFEELRRREALLKERSDENE